MMGYEPITCCRYCGNLFDAYVAVEDRICDACKEVTPRLERVELGVDGNAGFALLGGDLQMGKSMTTWVTDNRGNRNSVEYWGSRAMVKRAKEALS